jgi:phenylpropionate dioxygenase-like ring-hydroxylating dioxygenase large terminal subunit
MPEKLEASTNRIPDLRGDIRHLVPPLGLREYWHPGVRAKEVRRNKPTKVRMLGTDLCFYRDRQGVVVAAHDVCPHRGASLSEGLCHFAGTVTCPYHGWTFDGHGELQAVLGEGPDSKMVGVAGTSARMYPTRELKGIVFVWMGDGKPAPIEEDVPEEFFDREAQVLSRVSYWRAGWCVSLENSMDAHVSYLHRNALFMALPGQMPPPGAIASRTVWVGNGLAGLGRYNAYPSPAKGGFFYSVLGARWPRSNYRRHWGWIFRSMMTSPADQQYQIKSPKWGGGHHLPGMYRATAPGASSPESRAWRVRTAPAASFDLSTRQVVPVDENLTRLWYFHTLAPKTIWQQIWHALRYKVYMSWIWDIQFSQQDGSIMLNQRWDAPEALSVTDTEVMWWRRLVVTKHLGGRDAGFHFPGESLVGSEGLEDLRTVQTTAERSDAQNNIIAAG